MKTKSLWPKKPTMWMCGSELYVSVPFTWNLPELKQYLSQRSVWTRACVGGPAIDLMPNYLDGVDSVEVYPRVPLHGVLQRVNPLATRASMRDCSPDITQSGSQFYGNPKYASRLIQVQTPQKDYSR